MPLIEVESLKHFEQLSASPLCIVDFYATWCGPCKAISPVFEQLSVSASKSIVFAKCDVDAQKDVSRKCGIAAMPTFQFYKNGSKVDEIKGADITQLRTKIGYYVSSLQPPKTQTDHRLSSSATSTVNGGQVKLNGLVVSTELDKKEYAIFNPSPHSAGNKYEKTGSFLIEVVLKSKVDLQSLIVSLPAAKAIPKNITLYTKGVDSVGIASGIISTLGSYLGYGQSSGPSDEHLVQTPTQKFDIYSDEIVDGKLTLRLVGSRFKNIDRLGLRVDTDALSEVILGRVELLGVDTKGSVTHVPNTKFFSKVMPITSSGLLNTIPLSTDDYDPEQIKLMEEVVILLSRDDEPTGSASKKDSHLMVNIEKGLLHRAFSLFLFKDPSPEEMARGQGSRLLLQQRATEKITFPDMWTNTCCSHPLHVPGEVGDSLPKSVLGVKRAAQRKVDQELGILASDAPIERMEFLTRIHYMAASDGIWGEHEIDYILFSKLETSAKFDANPNEVRDTKWVTQDDLREMFAEESTSGLKYTPWFKLICETFLFKWWDALDSGALETQKDEKTIHRLGV